MRRSEMRSERGQSTVEFALVLPIILVLVMGIIEFAKAFNYWEQTNQIASDTTRWIVVDQLPAFVDASGVSQPANTGPTETQYRNFAYAQLLGSELRSSTPNACTNSSCGVRFCFTQGGGAGPNPTTGWAATTTLITQYKPLSLISGKFVGARINLKGSATMRLELPPSNTLTSDPGC